MGKRVILDLHNAMCLRDVTHHGIILQSLQAGSNAAVDGNNVPTVAAIVASINSSSPGPPTSPEPQVHTAGLEKAQNGVHSTRPVVRGQHVPVPRGRGRGATRTKGPLQLGRSKSETDEGGWTGAGFDVEDPASWPVITLWMYQPVTLDYLPTGTLPLYTRSGDWPFIVIECLRVRNVNIDIVYMALFSLD